MLDARTNNETDFFFMSDFRLFGPGHNKIVQDHDFSINLYFVMPHDRSMFFSAAVKCQSDGEERKNKKNMRVL